MKYLVTGAAGFIGAATCQKLLAAGHTVVGIDNLNDYTEHIENSKTKLYVARQWDPISSSEELKLLNHPSVSGLVYSTFRYDNPGPLANSDWVIHSDDNTQ